MSKKKNQDQQNDHSKNEEKILNFDEVKELTVGQVVRKQQDMEVGIEEDDNILDRYIKQHRQDIEAKKFETVMNAEAISDDEIEAVPTESEVDTVEEVADVVEENTEETDLGWNIHKVSAEKEKVSPSPVVTPGSELDSDWDEEFLEQEKSSKKKVLIWLALVTTFVAVLVTAFVWMNNMNSNQTKSSSSSSSSKTSSSISMDANVAAFEELYASFFTDSSQTKLKNSEFDKLSQLKEALDKIGESNAGYKAAKAKYDVLEKAIQAIQEINSKFDKPAIVDGQLDITATVKPGVSFTSVSTGLSAVDTLLASAINMGRTQTPANSGQGLGQAGEGAVSQTPNASDATPAPSTPVETPSYSAPPANPGWVNIGGVIYGMEIPAGVALQRDLSRVPYNQSAIDDVHNEAWNFNPGILENIINISRQRGYFVGNEYYLEKVNIINGRGYYNLFRTDGTYLFSINCKTGYFVGNGPGYADDLDY